MELKTFKVTMTKEFPAWDEKDGFVMEITAESKSKAIKYARREMADAGHTGGGCGRAWFRAEEKEDEAA